MAAGIPFMEETGRKAVKNGGHSNSKNDHRFWKNLLLLLSTSNLSFSYSSKLHNNNYMTASLPFSFKQWLVIEPVPF